MLTKSEKEHQATVAWFPPKEAVKTLQAGKRDQPIGRQYVIPRDGVTLERAVKMLENMA